MNSKLTNIEATIALERAFGRDGRECDPKVVLHQIGAMNVLALSGGKWMPIAAEDEEYGGTYYVGALLFLGHGKALEVVLDWNDTYSVRLVRRIAKGHALGTVVVATEASNVYCDELTDVCFSVADGKVPA
jgi:hypothetical protein